jgi:hypothetical protein
MKAPSTGWKERVAPDEEQRFAELAAQLRDVQASKSARYGEGRVLHRKPVLALRAKLEVLPDLPEHARHGLFATPGVHDAWVRLSNGGTDVQANTKPDIRGFAVKVLGVAGPGALGGDVDHQDLLFINHDAFASASSAEFVGIVVAAAKGPFALLRHAFGTYGLGGGLARLRKLGGAVNKPFSGFATERFDTVLPIACGPYAVRVLLEPQASGPLLAKDPADDLRARLATGPVEYLVRLQFFTDEGTTPIEDPTRPWPQSETPVVTVARLVLEGEGDAAFAARVERAAFDPWGALLAHRPLGEIMRARKVAYYESQKGRAARAE